MSESRGQADSQRLTKRRVLDPRLLGAATLSGLHDRPFLFQFRALGSAAWHPFVVLHDRARNSPFLFEMKHLLRKFIPLCKILRLRHATIVIHVQGTNQRGGHFLASLVLHTAQTQKNTSVRARGEWSAAGGSGGSWAVRTQRLRGLRT